MRLIDTDGGANSILDLSKKYTNTIIMCKYGDNIAPVFITEIGASYVAGTFNWGHPSLKLGDTDKFEIVTERPTPGIYNMSIDNGRGFVQRPVKVEFTGNRQWSRGMCSQNTTLSDIKGRFYEVNNIVLEEYKNVFNAVYPTFKEALDNLNARKYKHVAISPSITLMRGNNRIIFLRNFIPFMTFTNKMMFKIPPVSELFKKDCDYYEHLYRTTT